MTRPIDIRDLARRDAELTDARLGLDEDNNLAMTNQPDNSTIGTAASRDIGTDPDQIPLNSDLGTSSLVDTGTATGEIPTADDLSMVGQTVNYTGGNYQPNIANGIGVVRKMKNNTGGTILAEAEVSGTLLASYFVDGTGTFIESNAGVGSVWVNSSGIAIGNGNGADFTRKS